MKHLIVILMMLPVAAFSQIQVDDVGEGWKARVDSALVMIQQTSPEAWALIDTNVAKVEFWLGDRSSTVPASHGKKGTILLAVDEIELGVYNIAAVIVHESIHLHMWRKGIKLPAIQEEITAYCWELMFLTRLPGCPAWLEYNAIYQIGQLQQQNK